MRKAVYHGHRRFLSLMLAVMLCFGMVSGLSGCTAGQENGTEAGGEEDSKALETAEEKAAETAARTDEETAAETEAWEAKPEGESAFLGDGSKPVIGIAWRPDNAEAFYHFWEATIREAGGIPINLDEVVSGDISYDVYGMVSAECTDESGMLSVSSAEKLKENTYENSNVEEVMEDIDAVFFPGGEDISPSLMATPDTPKNNGEGFNATRDVSDYLLMNYCVDEDIPVLAVCRGMQMLATVSGGTIIQDIPDYCEENGIAYDNTHRMLPGTPNRDFTRHDVEITDTDSHIYRIVGEKVLKNVPSWHHQGVTGLENTKLKVTGVNVTGDLTMIEAVERSDKTFILGLQFHPEVVCKHILQDQSEDPCDYETCLNFIETLVDYGCGGQQSLQPAA